MRFLILSVVVSSLGLFSCGKPLHKSVDSTVQLSNEGLPLLAEGQSPSSQRLVVSAALERSRSTGRPLVIKVGGVWCAGCRYFDEKLADAKKISGNPLTAALSHYDSLMIEEGFVERRDWDFLPAPVTLYPMWFMYHPKTNAWASTFYDITLDFGTKSPMADFLNAFRKEGTEDKTIRSLIENQNAAFPIKSLIGLALVKDDDTRAELLRDTVRAGIKHRGLAPTRFALGTLLPALQTHEPDSAKVKSFLVSNLAGILDETEIAKLTADAKFSRRAVLLGYNFRNQVQNAYEYWKSSSDGLVRIDMAYVLKSQNAPAIEIDHYLEKLELVYGQEKSFSPNGFSYVYLAKSLLRRPVDLEKGWLDFKAGVGRSVTTNEDEIKKSIDTTKIALETAQNDLDKQEELATLEFLQFLLERNRVDRANELRVYQEFFRRLKNDPERIGQDGVIF